MKVVIEKVPVDQISIQVEGDAEDSPEDVAHAFVTVDEIIFKGGTD